MKKNSQNNEKTAQGNTSNMEELQERIIVLEQESANHLAGWQRAQADYQNLKRESDRVRLESIQLANKRLIETLIPVFDNFALATKHLPADLESNTWAQGILFIHKQLQDILVEEGVEILYPLQQPFNPYEHEAVDNIEENDSEANSGTVVEVLQVGYKLNGTLIRSARVKVSV